MTAQPKRVLLVDDDDAVIAPVQHALHAAHYDVLIARDGSEALMRVERDAPDLVLLDLVMPRRSGFSVLDRLAKSAATSPPIIMMTANTEPELRDYAESKGVAAFVNKPFEIDVLLEKIEEVLGAVAENS